MRAPVRRARRPSVLWRFCTWPSRVIWRRVTFPGQFDERRQRIVTCVPAGRPLATSVRLRVRRPTFVHVPLTDPDRGGDGSTIGAPFSAAGVALVSPAP